MILGGKDAGQRFVEALELHSHVANIGDVRSLAIHPATTTHSQRGDEDQLAAGVTPGWSASRSASRPSRTSSPTSRRASPPPRGDPAGPVENPAARRPDRPTVTG